MDGTALKRDSRRPCKQIIQKGKHMENEKKEEKKNERDRQTERLMAYLEKFKNNQKTGK